MTLRDYLKKWVGKKVRFVDGDFEGDLLEVEEDFVAVKGVGGYGSYKEKRVYRIKFDYIDYIWNAEDDNAEDDNAEDDKENKKNPQLFIIGKKYSYYSALSSSSFPKEWILKPYYRDLD